jgi:hypothetical protein
MSWNGRGLGNPLTIQELRSIVKKERHSLHYAMETKISKERVDPDQIE